MNEAGEQPPDSGPTITTAEALARDRKRDRAGAERLERVRESQRSEVARRHRRLQQGVDECPRCAKLTEAQSAASQEKVWEMISRYVEQSVRSELGVDRPVDERNHSQASRLVRDAVRRGLAGREHDLQIGIETAVGKVLDSLSNGLVVDNVVDADRAAQILEGLEEMGMIAGRETIEQRVEELAQERLAALRAEHGVVP